MTGSGDAHAPGAAPEGPPGSGSAPASEPDLTSFDRAIHELHGRIADLRLSVDDLGGQPPPPNAPPAQPPPSQPPPAVPTAYAAPPAYFEPPGYGEVPPPPAYAGYPGYQAGYAGYQEPPPYAAPPTHATPPPYAPPEFPQEPMHAQPPAYAGPPPAYAEPGVPLEGSDALGNFSRVDVGPFEDLLAMTAFEEQLSALPSMADVRVRRFGAGRAEIELETVGAVPVARELLRIAPDAQTGLSDDGTLTVELFAEQWTGPAADKAPPADAEAVTGEQPVPEPGSARG